MEIPDENNTPGHPCRACVVRPMRTAGTLWMKGFDRLPLPVQDFLSRHPWKIGIGSVVFLLLVFGYLRLIQEPAPEYITAEAVRGELIQTVEAVGTVTSERDLKLQFPVSGVVGEVLVKEGDTVEAGDKLAELRAYDLAAYVNSAYASLQAAQANLQELKEGTRPEDIAIAEAEVANKRAALQATRNELLASEKKLETLEKEAGISLVGEIGTARSTVSQQITRGRTALAVFDDVLEDNDVSDAFIRGEPGMKSRLQEERKIAAEIGEELLRKGINFDNYEDALDTMKIARSGILAVSNVLESLFSAIVTVPPTGSFTRSERKARKTDLTTEKTNLQTALTALDSGIKDLQDASASFDTKIAAEEAAIAKLSGTILSNESSLRTEEAELTLKRAGARQTDIDAAAAKVRQASADLARAQADFDDTLLYAPIDGMITKVNIKTGELLSTAFQQDAAITMLGHSPYRIEMYASEIDIPRVELLQEAEIELDAFPGKPFVLTVAEVDPAATSIDGVPKYRIKLDFAEFPEKLKIGMTGDTDIFTGRKNNVIFVPARAVLEKEGGSFYVRILGKGDEIEERAVRIGLEGENDIEILFGLKEGETVVVLIKK